MPPPLLLLQGATPLHTSVKGRVKSVARLLLEAGADINAADYEVRLLKH